MPPTTGARRRRRRVGAIALAVTAAVGITGACGNDAEEAQLSGFVREPGPRVDQVALPDLSADGAPFELRAEPGGVLVVYFGFTNCPDVCPTTLSDLRTAIRQLPEDQQDRVRLAMVSVDPGRDEPVLVDYVQTFVPGAHALLTDDDPTLRAVAEPFGVSYQVTSTDDGAIEVAHSSQMFLVDSEGQLLLTWQFGLSADQLAGDLRVMLDRETA